MNYIAIREVDYHNLLFAIANISTTGEERDMLDNVSAVLRENARAFRTNHDGDAATTSEDEVWVRV